MDKRHAVRLGDRSKFTRRNFRREPLDAVVRRVHLEDEAGLRADRRRIVLRMRAVGGADLDQPGAGAGHDVRHPERAADLDQLAARNDRLAAERQRVEDEKNGRRVVVDDGRILGSGQFADERAQMIVALAALALSRHRIRGQPPRAWPRWTASIASSARRARPRLVCSTVPVRLKTGRREERSPASSCASASAATSLGFRHGSAREAGRARIGERSANGIRRGVPPEALDRRRGERRPQHLIDRWKIAQAACGQAGHRILNSRSGTG